MILSKWCVLLSQSYGLLISGIATTLLLTILALCIGFSGGLLCAIATCKKYAAWWSWPLYVYVQIIRGTPVYVQLLIVYFALSSALGIAISPLFAGILTLGMNSIAYVSEIIKGGIDALAEGQWDACYVLGYSSVQTLIKVILPQALKIVSPSLVNETIQLLKETSIVSVIGVVELTKIGVNLSARTLDPITSYGIVAIIYLILTTGITLIAHKIKMEYDHDIYA